MLRLKLSLFFVAILAWGCSSSPTPEATASAKASAPKDVEQQLYESFRSARFQIDAAGDQLATAVEHAQKLAKGQAEETRQALLDVSDSLSQAGSKIADYTDELPAYEEFKQKFAEYDDERLQAIESCNQALKEIHEAGQTTDDLIASEPPEPERTTLATIASAIQEANDALEEAIKAMQGSAEE